MEGFGLEAYVLPVVEYPLHHGRREGVLEGPPVSRRGNLVRELALRDKSDPLLYHGELLALDGVVEALPPVGKPASDQPGKKVPKEILQPVLEHVADDQENEERDSDVSERCLTVEGDRRGKDHGNACG